MKLRKKPFLTLLTIILTLVVCSININTVLADTTEIYVDPEVSYAPIGSKFTVSIEIIDVSELFAWQANVTWNASLFWCNKLAEGDFLNAWGTKPTYFFGADLINETAGEAFPGATITGKEHGGTTGSGTLATLDFTAIGKGETFLNLTDVILLNIANEDIDFTSREGFFINTFIPPVADFVTTPALPEIGDTIYFDASPSYDPDGVIVKYEWDFGDDYNATGMSVTHSYSQAGSYYVKLTVEDETGIPGSKIVKLLIRYPHDLAVMNVGVSRRELTAGEELTMNAIVFNAGTEMESFNVTFYYDNNAAGTKTVANLAPDLNTTVTLVWDTTDVPKGTYKIKAVAETVPDEVYIADNTFIDGTVTINAPSGSLPLELVIGAISGVIIVAIIVAFLYMRSKGSSSSKS